MDRARFGVLVKIDGSNRLLQWVVEMGVFFGNFGAKSD